jgi:DGQHR domain-containing protein
MRNDPAAPKMLLFDAPVESMLQFCAIRRLQDEIAAPQRPESPAKVNALARFIRLDRRNVIPTAVIVSLELNQVARLLEPDAQNPLRLEVEIDRVLSEPDMPGLVIDGQHRLLGMKQADPTLRIAVVAMLGASAEESAFQFLVINNKASKVSADHVRALVGELGESENNDLEQRLEKARLSLRGNFTLVMQIDRETESPFYRLVKWPANREGQQWVVPSALEASLSYIASRNVRVFNESTDNLLEFFYTIWRTVREKWADLFIEDSKLLEKVGVICMSQYLAGSLVDLADWGQIDLRDPHEVRERTEELLRHQKKEFWKIPWASTSLDTRTGRELLVENLKQIARNIRDDIAWNTDVSLVDPATLGGS